MFDSVSTPRTSRTSSVTWSQARVTSRSALRYPSEAFHRAPLPIRTFPHPTHRIKHEYTSATQRKLLQCVLQRTNAFPDSTKAFVGQDDGTPKQENSSPSEMIHIVRSSTTSLTILVRARPYGIHKYRQNVSHIRTGELPRVGYAPRFFYGVPPSKPLCRQYGTTLILTVVPTVRRDTTCHKTPSSARNPQ